MTIAMATKRFKAIRRTKLYDLFAAAPLIAWYVFCAAQLLPMVTQQIALAKLFVQTDPSVLPASLVLRILSYVTTLVFFAVLVVMFAVRHVPKRAAPGFIHAAPLWPAPFSASACCCCRCKSFRLRFT